MLKQFVQIFAVITYALLTLAAPGLIVCQHADGRTMIELAASPCCLIDESKSKCCSSEVDAESDGEHAVSSNEDPCSDSPVQISNALPNQTASHSELSLSAMCIDLTFATAPNYEISIKVKTDFHDPPPSIALLSLTTTIILC
jgi:hypothetical protein